ncbi:uncharacterized protein N0V89_006517 [Didymosphaeria variabile]|uniref:Uncharacterized protein n=1 Tax=Didymosphaeria variabile TaxID=1932322 RepID=A0A9W8XH78_9PLEO|nr:uncharacterized protein N0V89_006517 [Didymosphaeria variabile]KAJ4351178.1 hypothetical protein N0V89_006517 [Didymosphaeria variabile]
MPDKDPADDAADGPVPQYILGQANPECATCIDVLTRSHRRNRERMEAIREKERLEKHTQQVEFSFVNYRLLAERKIERLEQRLGNTISLEDHDAKITEKADECRASLKQTTAEIQKVYAKEKETLLTRLANRENQLDSDKKRKELLTNKIRELQMEVINFKKEKSNDEQAKFQRVEEAATKLHAAIDLKDKEIAWLKAQMKQREEEHRQAISPRKDLINRQQPTTPSSQHRATPNNMLYR